MEKKSPSLEFYGGTLGRLMPLLIGVVFIGIAATHQANIQGYVMAFFMGLIGGVVFAKDQQAYGRALIKGLAKPMFGVIALAVILASVSGALLSKSGLIQTLAVYLIDLGLTGKVFVAATFVLTCLVSFATGTSVGTYFVVGPILYPIACLVGADPAFAIGAIVAGAAFGDNLSPISDTTIASATTQAVDIGGVVRTRTKYSIPVAVIAFFLYLFFGGQSGSAHAITGLGLQAAPRTILMLTVPATIIFLTLRGKHLITSLSWGVVIGVVVALLGGVFKPVDLLRFPAPFKVQGILLDAIMGSLPTVAFLLAMFPLLGVMEENGVIESIAGMTGRLAGSVRKTEATIVGSIGLLCMITGVISVAMLALGDIIRDMGGRCGIDGYRRANLMDCTGVTFCFIVPWTVHAIVPAMITSQAQGAVAVAPAVIPLHNFYSWVMLVFLIFAIITGYGRVSKLKAPAEAESNYSA